MKIGSGRAILAAQPARSGDHAGIAAICPIVYSINVARVTGD
jgi:hypothetical protein